jgi:hypothetical protein
MRTPSEHATVFSPKGDQAVGLVGDRETIDAVADLCQPWLTVTRGTEAHAIPTIVTSLGYSSYGDHEFIEHVPDDEPPRCLHVSHASREIVIDAETSEWRVMQVLRALRHLLRWQSYGPSTLFLHGGMVSFDGVGVAYVGAKKAGKTSSVIAALLAGADFVVNDDLTVYVEDADLVGYGWPRTVAVRRDTIQTLRHRLPGFPRSSRDLRHPANRWAIDVLREKPEDGLASLLWVDPCELAGAADAGIRPSAPIRALVLPTFDDVVEPMLEPLTPAEAEMLIIPHVEARAVNYDPFLASWFATNEPGGKSVLGDLLITVPAYRLHQRMEILEEAATLVSALAALEGGSPCPA